MPPFLPELDHLFWMKQALALANEAGEKGEIPVGAIVVHHPPTGEPRVIGRGFNQRETDHDPSNHAEMVALRRGGKACCSIGGYWIARCYVTLEPCPMANVCGGGSFSHGVFLGSFMAFGCRDPNAGAVDSLFTLCTDPRLIHRLQSYFRSHLRRVIRRGLLQNFFAARRSAKPPAQD